MSLFLVVQFLTIIFVVEGVFDVDNWVLHVNDIRSHTEPTNLLDFRCKPEKERCYGGFAGLAATIALFRDEHPSTGIIINSGNLFNGSLHYMVNRHYLFQPFWSKLHFDYMTFGENELRADVSEVKSFMAFSRNTRFLACNVDASENLGELPYVESRYQFRFKNTGKSFLLIGYVPSKVKTAWPSSIKITDEMACIKKEVEGAEKDDIVVVIGSGGHDFSLKIAKQFPRINLVLGGGFSKYLLTGSDVENGVNPIQTIKNNDRETVVSITSGFTRVVSLIQVPKMGQIVAQTLAVKNKEEPFLQEIKDDVSNDVAKIKKQYEKLEKTYAVGTNLIYSLYSHCRKRQCSLGSFLTDAVAKEAKLRNSSLENVPLIVLTQAGALRAPVKKGKVLLAEVTRALPLSNKYVHLIASGKMIRDALEHSVFNYGETRRGFGGFLQVSGIKVTYDRRREPYSRLVSVQLQSGSELDNLMRYNVILPAFLFNGGDMYTMFEDNEHVELIDYLPKLEVEMFIEAIYNPSRVDFERILGLRRSGVEIHQVHSTLLLFISVTWVLI